jgi:DnaJ-class molecular chaperone
VLGGRVTVPTVTGDVTLTIPPGSNTGSTLRLKGKGIPARGGEPAGDQYVRLKVVLPKPADEELKAFLEGWAPKHVHDPREELMREARR